MWCSADAARTGLVNSEGYCIVALTCTAPVETSLFGQRMSAIKLPLLQFHKGLYSVCGVEQVPEHQGCSGNTVKNWSVSALCYACAVRGFEATSVRRTKLRAIRVHRKNMWPACTSCTR
jgi:hypothetical protein